MTVAWVLAVINKMSEVLELQRHATSLQGPRRRGSTTTHGLDALPPERELTEITARVPPAVKVAGCRYFAATAKELNGQLGAGPYGQLDKDQVKRRQGPHGPELYLDVSPGEARFLAADTVTVVLGPAGEQASTAS